MTADMMFVICTFI